MLPAAGHGAVLAAAVIIAVIAWMHVRSSESAAVLAASAADASSPGHHASGHETADGFQLSASGAESVIEGGGCVDGASVRSFDIAAIRVDITVNRYLDHDPEGRMYVLESELERVRAEERDNENAREGRGASAVSIGLQGDAIQPLTMRVNQGECLRIKLRNAIVDEPVSLHIHGSSLRVAGTSQPAIATNPSATAAPGGSVAYEWMVPPDQPEGTHDFHSHGDTREQTVHGLFGAVIVEPAGSRYVDPRTGAELESGWDAIIETAEGPSFREFALFYHEIGNENYQLRDRKGGLVPLVDPTTKAYRPDGRALNYRSEPFMNRLALQQSLTGAFDESLAYSSYAFGDPATPVMRSYLGDPAKQRLIHGGSEVMHVHHVHGGAVRWRRQPGVERTGFASGLDKHPPIRPQASERTDSQAIGPSETFDIEAECGSGGCQQSVGDFLVHCHVAQHYFAGMWGLWRVYNTLQDGVTSTDPLPPLRELPDRASGVNAAVTSDRLVGTTVDWSGKQFIIAASDLAGWVERQLPPSGLPRGYDASVLDWERRGDVYINEPEDSRDWPGHAPDRPGERPPLLFDPKTGKLAYPFLRPHLGKRPPFPPDHQPAPYLDPMADGLDPPAPGANGPASICPDGARPKQFNVNAITLPIAINEREKLVDPAGEIFVLREQEDAVRADNNQRVPLAIRANAGEECIDVLLRSELEDNAENHGFSKVNLHIHFVQFDVQASDGVVAGFNYEQSVRPYTVEGETLAAGAEAGARSLKVLKSDRFQARTVVGVGMDKDSTFEVARIAAIEGDVVVFDAPLRFDHDAGEIVSTEFVRYRWYPDVQFGTAYFHDHVNAISSWKHGLFGALIAEPPGSSYHDPSTGDEVSSGPIADIRTGGPVSVDVIGSFRELVLFVQDDNPVAHLGRSTGSSFNLRAEPLRDRDGDPSRVFSSALHGDPETPVLRARLGDPVVVRALVGGTNDVHTVHIDGHWFRAEGYSGTSPPISTIGVGISERQEIVIPAAGGPQRMPGDYLYYNGRSFKLAEGSWGILRVLAGVEAATLQPLPGRNAVDPAASVCPAGVTTRRFEIAAIDAPLPMLGRSGGKLYVLERDRQAVLEGEQSPQPLVLHINVGDCVRVELTNRTSGGPVTFHTDMLAADPRESAGVEAGDNPRQDVAPGETRTYTFYAHPDVGEAVALIRDWGDVTKNPRAGLYGAFIVGPTGATYREPVTGQDLEARASWQAIVNAPEQPPYRDFTLFFQDEDEAIGNHRMPYSTRVDGVVGLNYRSAPLEHGSEQDDAGGSIYRNTGEGDSATTLVEAIAGDPVKLHVLSPSSEQFQVFSVEGHEWPVEPGRTGTNVVNSQRFGGLEAFTLSFEAGGRERLAGDYLYGDHREPYREAGLWGIFRVHDGRDGADIRPLTAADGGSLDWRWIVVTIGAVLISAAAGLVAVRRR